jgi:hypothetical protein
VGGSRSPHFSVSFGEWIAQFLACPSGHGSRVSMTDVTETKDVHGSRKLDPMTPKGSGYEARKLDPITLV